MHAAQALLLRSPARAPATAKSPPLIERVAKLIAGLYPYKGPVIFPQY